MSRVCGAKPGGLWGQQASRIEAGAAGSIGMDFAAKQPNDGYTFVVGNLGPVAVNPLLSKVPYNIEKDFVPVSMISTGPNVLVVRADAQFKSLKEVIDFAKANPGKLNYGTSGPGSVSHLSSEMLKNIPSRGRFGLQGRRARGRPPRGQINLSSDSPWRWHNHGVARALCVTGSCSARLFPSCRRTSALHRR
jgi:hypothetical protein